MPASGNQATAQVDCPAQTQPLGDLSEPLAARRQEPAQEAAFAQFRQSVLPGLGGRAQSLEDLRAIEKMPASSRRRLSIQSLDDDVCGIIRSWTSYY